MDTCIVATSAYTCQNNNDSQSPGHILFEAIPTTSTSTNTDGCVLTFPVSQMCTLLNKGSLVSATVRNWPRFVSETRKRVTQVFELREYNSTMGAKQSATRTLRAIECLITIATRSTKFSIVLESEIGTADIEYYDQQQNPLSNDASERSIALGPEIFVGRITHLPVHFLPALEFLKSDGTRVTRQPTPRRSRLLTYFIDPCNDCTVYHGRCIPHYNYRLPSLP